MDSLANPVNTIRGTVVGLRLDRRRRQWPNVKPTVGKCLVFAGSKVGTLRSNMCTDSILLLEISYY